jgi:hypothetical protein
MGIRAALVLRWAARADAYLSTRCYSPRVRAVRIAIFWSAIALVMLSPAIIAVVLTDPEWYRNVPFWLIVGPGIVGALALGPAWYHRRRTLLRQEGLTASGQVSESRSRAPRSTP